MVKRQQITLAFDPNEWSLGCFVCDTERAVSARCRLAVHPLNAHLCDGCLDGRFAGSVATAIAEWRRNLREEGWDETDPEVWGADDGERDGVSGMSQGDGDG